jgi:hypothetical protein
MAAGNIPYVGLDGEEKPLPDARQLVTVFRYLPDNERLVHKNGQPSDRYITDLSSNPVPFTNSNSTHNQPANHKRPHLVINTDCCRTQY